MFARHSVAVLHKNSVAQKQNPHAKINRDEELWGSAKGLAPAQGIKANLERAT
jgi:hypothetical protein